MDYRVASEQSGAHCCGGSQRDSQGVVPVTPALGRPSKATDIQECAGSGAMSLPKEKKRRSQAAKFSLGLTSVPQNPLPSCLQKNSSGKVKSNSFQTMVASDSIFRKLSLACAEVHFFPGAYALDINSLLPSFCGTHLRTH